MHRLCRQRARHAAGTRAFSLTELLVVVAIIAILATLTLPSMGPMIRSNQTAEVINTLNGLMVTAQAAAQAQGIPVGLRIERAFKVNSDGRMQGRNGQLAGQDGAPVPIWLDHQQVRLVTFAAGREATLTYDANSKVYELPEGVWVVPGYVIDQNDDRYDDEGLADDRDRSYEPNWPYDASGNELGGNHAVPYNPAETFYIMFGPNGELQKVATRMFYYVDRTLGWYSDEDLEDGFADKRIDPWISHPHDSAISLLLYDREKYLGIGAGANPTVQHAERREFLFREAKPVYVNRSTGSIVEERP